MRRRVMVLVVAALVAVPIILLMSGVSSAQSTAGAEKTYIVL
jgi:hypothetical protein